MVELRGVSKIYARRVGGRVHALRNASLRVGDGEMVAVVGAAGAGKSTLLRLVYGEERPSAGLVLVDGADVGALRPDGLARLRRRLGIVPEEPRLLADRTSFGNLMFVLRALGVPRREGRGRALRALRAVGLGRRVNAHPGELVGGERWWLSLARALVTEPRLLVVDEPTPALSAATSDVVALLRAEHAHGTTVLVATHASALAAALGARPVILDAGRVTSDGTTHDPS